MSDHPHAAVVHTEVSPHDAHANHRRDYFRIFWVLGVLTVVEIGVAYLKIDRRVVASLLVGLAMTKAAFVGLFYMHLRYEKRSLLWLAAIPFPLAGLYAAFLMLDAHNVLRAITLPWK
jgi:cytochrome c oxidase subunit 4